MGATNTFALPPVARPWWPAGRAGGRTRAAGGVAGAASHASATAPAAADATAEVAADAALVRQAAAGDRDAFGQLVRRYLPAAHAAALTVLGETADAADCCQDAFVAALTRLEECRPAEKFRGWLLTIVRNRAIDLQRRQRVRRAEVLDVGAGTPAGGGADGEPAAVAAASRAPDPLADVERADARLHLRRALATLTPTRREVVLLHDLEGWTHREIAAHLGVAEGTVRAHLFWARRALRERLSADLRTDSGTGSRVDPPTTHDQRTHQPPPARGREHTETDER